MFWNDPQPLCVEGPPIGLGGCWVAAAGRWGDWKRGSVSLTQPFLSQTFPSCHPCTSVPYPQLLLSLQLS